MNTPALYLGGLLALSCSAEPGACRVGMARAALINGDPRALYLKLEVSQEQAVVQVLIRSEAPPMTERCSGVLVAAGIVLTAKHCARGLDSSQVKVLFSATDDESFVGVDAAVAGRHADLDLMVLSLSKEDPRLAALTPLPLARGTPRALQAGGLVQTAGYGLSADGRQGVRAFIVQELITVDHQDIVVDAASRGGACFGDSGGPLLLRDDDGAVRTYGVLRSGSKTCFAKDSFTRVGDDVVAWIHDLTGIDPSSPALPEAGGTKLGREGRCFGQQAIWSDTAGMQSNLCEAPNGCGWSDHAQGFRCLAPAADPCRGVSDLGSCSDGVATRCVQGQLQENPCATCGYGCARSPRTGATICLNDSDT